MGAVAIWLMPALAIARTENATLESLIAQNFSRPTMCAEEDNVSVPLFAPAGLGTLEIIASHPQYDFFNDNCSSNFANCSIDSADDFTFTPGEQVLFDDGRTVIQGVRVERWFLPNTMVATVAGGPAFDSHFVRFIRRIGATNLFPEVMVINMDGNIRLKPQAPVGKPNNDTCFGSSVLVGPADPSAERPVAEIVSLSYDPTEDRFDIAYRDGSTATLFVQTVDRSQAAMRVGIGYPVSNDMPAAIFGSMYIADGNSDVDRIRSDSGTVGILDFIEDTGQTFTFFRAIRSVHNTSAPDIQIGVGATPPPPVTCNGLPATIVGTFGNDTLVGTPGNDVIHGQGGIDFIEGLGGRDVICGGSGIDALYSGQGKDQLFGGGGNDVVIGGRGNDRLFGQSGRDFLNGGGGRDRCDGGGGTDRATRCEQPRGVP